MSWFKDQIIEQESDRLTELWEENFAGIRAQFPDEPPSTIYDISELGHDGFQDKVYTEIMARVMDGFADAADNLRKREKENR